MSAGVSGVWVVVGLMQLGACHARLPVPDLGAATETVYPPPPDAPRVAYVGALTGPAGGFSYPVDVACGPGHEIAVADPQGHRVWVIDLDNGRARVIDHVGSEALRSPVGVSYRADGRVIIVDSAMAAVLVGVGKRGGARTLVRGDPLVRPTAAVGLADGGLVVVDAGAHALFHTIPSQGLVELGPGRGELGQGFNFPVDVTVGDDGAAYVCDTLHGVISRVADGAVTPVAGGLGEGGASLVRPKGVAVEADGTLHVVDAGMQHVQVYGPDGRLLGRYGGPGDGPGALGLPAGICLDDDGYALVADPVHRRVQVYRLLWRVDGGSGSASAVGSARAVDERRVK